MSVKTLELSMRVQYMCALKVTAVILVFGCLLLSACVNNAALNNTKIETESDIESKQQEFYENVMNAAPFLPSEQSEKFVGCPLKPADETYKTSKQVNYSKIGWEQRISHNPTYVNVSSDDGRVFVIDMADYQGEMAYKYLSNDNTHNDLYEPWSSSKIFAFTGAVAQMRKRGLGAQAKIGQTYLADMITGINSYEDFGTASEIATHKQLF